MSVAARLQDTEPDHTSHLKQAQVVISVLELAVQVENMFLITQPPIDAAQLYCVLR